ncbi:hypothetical protein DPD57_23430 [Salmonella enterica subsp. enterica serovar Kottbus]|nr:hypothetical protein [Salmonella enterica subsp. enterica serovar Kottbus]ECF6943240.1 hypothetical protein [Salmonella enterica subsp. enterica]
MCTFVVATPILRLVLYALTDDTIITYQELYQAITKKQPESIEVYRIKAQIQRPAPLLRTVTAYRSQAHALTAEKQALQCGVGILQILPRLVRQNWRTSPARCSYQPERNYFSRLFERLK